MAAMLTCDILIKGGKVVDGTGAPAFLADVAITGDKITAVGPSLAHIAVRVVDATGHIVTPGFVDIHTHFDGQITWDPLLSPSTQHGVTTVMFGNCGVGFAPCRTKDRDHLIQVLEGVEDIPGTALHEGIQWNWETFPEYLNSLSNAKTACDFLALLTHVPVRVWTMGERAEQPATADEIQQMRKMVADAMEAGAAGFSTSRTLLHRDLEGTVIPSTYADRAELAAIFAGIADGGGGLFEMIEDFADPSVEFDWIGKLSKGYGIPVTLCPFPVDDSARKIWLNAMDKINADGGCVTAQASVKTQGNLQSLRSKYHIFMGHETFQRELQHLPADERLQRMRSPEVKKRILSEKSFFDGKPFTQLIFDPFNMYQLIDGGEVSYDQQSDRDSFGAKAQVADLDPLSLIYDFMVNDGIIWAPLAKTANQAKSLAAFDHPDVKVGLGDAGAHLGIFTEAACPTFMLTHYARDRKLGPTIPLERAVRMQTMETAHTVGLKDRGVVAAGLRADINIIDFQRLKLNPPFLAADLPSGAERWTQLASGYKMTLCAGVPTFEHDSFTGALPGRLVRNPIRQHLKVHTEVDAAQINGPEPRSTHDTVVADAELVGGASAVARAANKNMAKMRKQAQMAADFIGDIGNFLSSKPVRDAQLQSAQSQSKL